MPVFLLYYSSELFFNHFGVCPFIEKAVEDVDLCLLHFKFHRKPSFLSGINAAIGDCPIALVGLFCFSELRPMFSDAFSGL